MSLGGYNIKNQAAVHFLSFAVVGWADVFTRPLYQNIIIDNLRFCQEHQGLILNAWCLMSNHIHLVVSSKKEDLSEILRDFKSYTSKQIIKAIANNRQESRREWLIQMFKDSGSTNRRNKEYQFWRQDNQPKECFSVSFTLQKINYIHQNPVTAGLVFKAEDYRLNSAADYAKGKKCGL